MSAFITQKTLVMFLALCSSEVQFIKSKNYELKKKAKINSKTCHNRKDREKKRRGGR